MSAADRDELIKAIADGVRVLRSRDAVAISEELVLERARNIAAAILGNYHVAPLEPTS